MKNKYIKKLMNSGESSKQIILPKNFLARLGINNNEDMVLLSFDEKNEAIIIKKFNDSDI